MRVVSTDDNQETYDPSETRFRWVCSCGAMGMWTWRQTSLAPTWSRHVERGCRREPIEWHVGDL